MMRDWRITVQRIKMAETEKSLSKEQIFRQVKQLCMKADFAPSRRLICQAAGLTPPDPMKISRAFIRGQTQNKIVHQMLDIEQAFARLRKTFSGDEGSAHGSKSGKHPPPDVKQSGKAFRQILD